MKKVLFPLVLLSILVFTTACQKPEEVTLSKYFQALKAKDRDTMASMAIEPVQMNVKSYKVLSIEPAKEIDAPLASMVEKLEKLKVDKAAQIAVVQEKKALAEEAKGKNKKAGEEAEATLNAETEKFKQMQAEYTNLKNQVDFERNLVKLSTNIENNQEACSGKCVDTTVNVLITSSEGQEKEYMFVLRKYVLMNEATKRAFPNRLVILKIQSK